jgi:hypothetical protein
MQNELSKPLAEQINALHETIAESGKLLLESSIALGSLLYEADQTPGFDFDAVAIPEPRQQVFRNCYDRREQLRQTDFLGALNVPRLRAPESPKESGIGVDWMGFLTPLGSFTQWLQRKGAETPVDQWPDATRESLRIRLKPLVDLYDQLDR